MLILDNCEDPLENDHELFTADLESVIEHCSKIKVLLTSRRPLNKLAFNQEKCFNLYPLPKESALKLLISKSPRNINNNEIVELLSCQIPARNNLNLGLQQYANRHNNKLLNHPFTELLGGHPQAISLAAPLLKDNSLKELFYAFCESNVLDVIDDPSVGQNPYTSLRVSLELSIERVRKNNEAALNLFGLIGMLPSGANKEEITEMWGDKSWVPLKDELVRASLLIFKTDDLGSFVYNMLPFMSIRATEILEENPSFFNEYHMKCCRLCKEYCIEFYNSEKTIEDVEGLVSIENNIWACINRAVSINKIEQSFQNELTPVRDELTPLPTCEGAVNEKYKQAYNLLTAELNLFEMLNEFELSRSLEVNENQAHEEEKDSRSHLFSAENKDDYSDNQINNFFFDEELLVIYYITNLIYMNKNEDALRAVTAYLKKPNISQIGLANLNRMYAVLLMISVDSNFTMTSIKYFKNALEIYHSLRMSNGVAVCQLGILKIFHDKFEEFVAEMLPEQKDMFIKECFCLINNSYELFVKIEWDDGKTQCKLIENSLNEKIKPKINSEKDLKSEHFTIHYSSMIHEDNTILLNVIVNK